MRAHFANEAQCERCQLLSEAGTTLSSEVERLRAALDTWGTQRGRERLVAEWRPLWEGSALEVLWAEGPCRVRYPAGTAREEVDAKLLLAGLLRVGPALPYEAREGPSLETAVVHPLHLPSMAPHPPRRQAPLLNVDRANPAALSVALYDALAAVLEARLFVRGEDFSGPRLLLLWLRGAVEKLRAATPPEGADDDVA